MLLDPDEISDIVTQDVTMQCVDAAGQSLVLEATLGYDVQDPYAVTTTFRTDQYEVPWTFARELLTRGLTSPVGEGDVQVWPSRNDSEQDVVVIKLSSLDGELVARARFADVTRFVNQTLARVPVGTEGTLINVDELIGQLLAV